MNQDQIQQEEIKIKTYIKKLNEDLAIHIHTTKAEHKVMVKDIKEKVKKRLEKKSSSLAGLKKYKIHNQHVPLKVAALIPTPR